MNAKQWVKKLRKEIQISGPSGCLGFSGWLRKTATPSQYKKISKHLGDSFNQEIFYNLLFPNTRKTCCSPACSNTVSFDKKKLRYKRYCSPACSWKDPKIIKKREENELKRSNGLYTNVLQRPDIRKANSALKKTEEYKAGMRERELIRSNGEYSDSRGRKDVCERRAASHRRHELSISNGTRTNSSQRKEVRKKISNTVSSLKCQKQTRATYLKRSGGRYAHPMHDPRFLRKQQISARQLRRVSYKGNTWMIQGYEDIAIRKLVKLGVLADRISDLCNSFPYKGSSKHGPSGYTPDFHIEDSKLYIEVKSEFTLRDPATSDAIADKVINKGKGVIARGNQFLLLLIGRPKDSKFINAPRYGKILGYIYATPLQKDFKMKYDLLKLKQILGEL